VTAKGRKLLAVHASKLEAVDKQLLAVLAKPRQEMFLAGLAAIARLGRENGDRPGGISASR